MLKKQKSFRQQESGQHFETVRLGLKQYTISKDIDQFSVIPISKALSNAPYYAILTNHQVVYLFNHKLGTNKMEESNEMALSDVCQDKINLRQLYKLPSLLFIKMKYSHNFEIIFMLLSNGQIAVLTDELYLLGLFDIICCDPQNNIKHCLDFQYYEKQAFRQARKIKSGFFVFLFTDSLELHEIQIVTNHKLSKFKPSYKCTLTQVSKQILDHTVKHPVNLNVQSFFRSVLFDPNDKLNKTLFLCCNCLKQVYFYLINKQTMALEQTIKITQNQLNSNICDYQISPNNKRIIIALHNGTIKGFSYKQQGLALLYSMKVSQTPIHKIYLQSLEKLYTFSKDSLFTIVNLNTLSTQQKFKLGECLYFQFINQFYSISVGRKSQSLYNKDQQEQHSRTLILNEFHCKYSKIFECNSDIVGYRLEEQGELIQLSDNSLLINKRIGNKTQVIQTYLPPKSVSVKCIEKNPFCQVDQYWILTQKSQIYKYVVSPQRQVNVSQVIELHQFVDKNQTVYRYSVSYFCFATKMVPIEYDSETTQKQYLSNDRNNEQLMPLCFGTKTGQLLIVSICNVLNIFCRIKYFSTPITNIIELHPILSGGNQKVLLIYESRKSDKIIILEMSRDKQPIQLFKFNCHNKSVRFMSRQLMAMINGPSFNIIYCKYCQKQCSLYRQEHYNPGVLEKSTVAAISYCSNTNKKYIIVGFSLGEILIYYLHRNISEKTYIHLNLLYVIENSKEQPIEFVRYNDFRVYFNLGSFLVSTIMHPIKDQTLPVNVGENKRILKHQINKQFSQLIIKSSTKQLKEVDQPEVKLPTLKQKGRQNRSSSIGILGHKQRIEKPQLVFHFPDIKLYRSLINKSMIH